MPDTAKNQDAYPQPDTQKPGLGFPLARIAVVFSLSVEPFLIWRFAATQVRDKANWGCCVLSGIGFFLVMYYSRIV